MNEQVNTATNGKGIIILGSARSDGNTSTVVRKLGEMTGMEVIDLNDWHIEHFTYDQDKAQDDFLRLMSHVLDHDTIVLSTPVYWYSMSSILKMFLDRFTDLIKWHKPMGRRLRGKTLAMLSSSESHDRDDFFVMPFRKTADYLGMHYAGDGHVWTTKGELSGEALAELDKFAALVGKVMP